MGLTKKIDIDYLKAEKWLVRCDFIDERNDSFSGFIGRHLQDMIFRIVQLYRKTPIVGNIIFFLSTQDYAYFVTLDRDILDDMAAIPDSELIFNAVGGLAFHQIIRDLVNRVLSNLD
jgi:hypothetical protein